MGFMLSREGHPSEGQKQGFDKQKVRLILTKRSLIRLKRYLGNGVEIWWNYLLLDFT